MTSQDQFHYIRQQSTCSAANPKSGQKIVRAAFAKNDQMLCLSDAWLKASTCINNDKNNFTVQKSLLNMQSASSSCSLKDHSQKSAAA